MKKFSVLSVTGVFLILILLNSNAIAENNTHISWTVEPQFDEVRSFSENMAIVKKDNRYGFINNEGRLIVKPRFIYLGDFQEGLAVVSENGKTGFIDSEGKIIIEPQFDWAQNFSSGLALVGKNGKSLFINREGLIVFGSQFEFVSGFSEGLTAIKKNGEWGYIDTSGKLVIEPQFEDVRIFSEGLAAVKKNGKWGFINKEGRVILKFQYETDDISDFSDGRASLNIKGKLSFINKQGKTVSQSNGVWYSSEGLVSVEKCNKWGFKNRSGTVVIKPQFDDVKDFSEGFAAVKKNGKWGFIKSPLAASMQAESLEKSGRLIGVVKSISDKEVTVGGRNIAEQVMMGDKLCLYAEEKLIILRSTFPMQTITKCGIVSGSINDIKPGMKVYKYRKAEKKKE